MREFHRPDQSFAVMHFSSEIHPAHRLDENVDMRVATRRARPVNRRLESAIAPIQKSRPRSSAAVDVTNVMHASHLKGAGPKTRNDGFVADQSVSLVVFLETARFNIL